MGSQDDAGAQDTRNQAVTYGGRPPRVDEVELTLIGPGYGESVILHVGDGAWVLVDSCGRSDAPAALDYLRAIGVDPSQAVAMIVATHWHDDHIRGLARMVQVCAKASFCCATVLRNEEFLAMIDALEDRHHASFGSGVREIHRVFSLLRQTSSTPTLALANRHILEKGTCRIRALSPDDEAFLRFMRALGRLMPKIGQAETRIPSLSPNDASVVLRVEVGDVAVLLGSDLEKGGWLKILQDETRPPDTASAFKVPHHGAESADEPRVWKRLLAPDPVALLAPWRRGGRTLPSDRDAQRILARTSRAYATARADASRPARRAHAVDRTIRESGIRLRRTPEPGAVRLRRRLRSGEQWRVEMFGAACHLQEYVRIGR